MTIENKKELISQEETVEEAKVSFEKILSAPEGIGSESTSDEKDIKILGHLMNTLINIEGAEIKVFHKGSDGYNESKEKFQSTHPDEIHEEESVISIDLTNTNLMDSLTKEMMIEIMSKLNEKDNSNENSEDENAEKKIRVTKRFFYE
jgi:hypothetical protein